ncbi:MAG: DUF6443 domain-containing protein [Bacteroidota bacterium]
MEKGSKSTAFTKTLILLMLCVRVSAQTPTENYIKRTVYTAPSTQGITEQDTLVSVTYFDGLGRPKQQINVRAGGQGQDIVIPIVYDAFGRQVREYLPYTAPTQNGNIHSDPLAEVEDTADDTFGFKDDAINTPDNTEDYSYDVNGNMISDTNKNITGIAYNHLNLSTEITFNDDPNQKISYFYSADGIKQQKVVTDNAVVTTTDYTGGYIYENSSLKFINQAEGYIEPDGAGWYDYVYQYKDIWGNIRIAYSDANDDGSVDASEIRREQNYYPFGLEHRGSILKELSLALFIFNALRA